ncbi:MAG: carbohydrate kinase family protein [Solirubrobacteraceae bacterium]
MSAGRDLDVLVLGDVNPDLVLSDRSMEVAFGQAETLVDDAELTIGGSGAIMACAAARLGLRTALAGLVGADQFGAFMRDAVVACGVDVSGVVVDAGERTGLTVVLARPGDRAILTFPGAIAAMTADRVAPELLARARHVHVSSLYLQTALAPGLPALLSGARASGATTSVDPNWDPSGGWDGGLPELLAEVDVLLPNEVEVCRIAGLPDVEAAAARLAAAGPLVAVKLGARGALSVPAGGGSVVRAEPPRELTDPVDAVGAGDTFDAGLLAAWLAGEPLTDALALACACGALSLRAAGGTAAQPTLDEARKSIRGGAPAGPPPPPDPPR